VSTRKPMTFTPVNRIGEPCQCCGRDRGPRAVRGVRVVCVEVPAHPWTAYYCDACIGQLAKAKAHP
jgi:hypothetical protein